MHYFLPLLDLVAQLLLHSPEPLGLLLKRFPLLPERLIDLAAILESYYSFLDFHGANGHLFAMTFAVIVEDGSPPPFFTDDPI
jgi:hypothetical protein